ncbi:MarR family transcriptional regulator [Pseudonocardia sp. DR1-2]|uniref:MarR family transcriptional regulator n=1 Tax=Pseudonocardia sp. DR1-2 TaxID=2951168 RepID=UPI0020436375|nr:MarR family transcriptional regulator [Pseudonocardia sp. DR1-2]MCM3847075.1 MarR family transcriptional regulator [Pseudonocardia sp. DR1-2]
MTASGPPPDAATELEDLLQFFYQCPVGLVDAHDDGRVRRVNPAAVRMLAPALRPGEDLDRLHPVLDRLAPGLSAMLTTRPERLGPLHPGTRVVVNVPPDGGPQVELRFVRVAPDHVMVVAADVTVEQRLARRTLKLAARLRDVIAAAEAYRDAAAEVLGVAPSGVGVLEELVLRGPRTPSAISRRVGLSSSSVTAVVDQLESAGLVERVANPADRRSTLVTLAPGASDRIRPVLDLLVSGIDRVAEGASAHAQDVAATLEAVTSALRSRTAVRGGQVPRPVRPTDG